MQSKNTLRLALAGLFCALAVVGSFISFPIFGSKCAPVQHLVNVLCAVLLGPWYALGVAFLASLIRNLLGIGSLLAFPGSMCGALIASLIYLRTKKILPTVLGEIFGTGIIGALLAYPIAAVFMGKFQLAFYVYVIPFLISTSVGGALGGLVGFALQKNGTLQKIQTLK